MGSVVHQPAPEHHCAPGWKSVPLDPDSHLRAHGWTSQLTTDPDLFHATPGTKWRCDCGRVWVAKPNVPGRLYARWVPESRFARWRRERRERQEGDRG